jgi:hypothetical protein
MREILEKGLSRGYQPDRFRVLTPELRHDAGSKLNLTETQEGLTYAGLGYQ